LSPSGADIVDNLAGGDKMLKVVVTLDEQQQDELQMILADKNAEEAFIFLKEVIWAQVQAVHRKELRGHLEKGA
jgi:dsDNA-binding SOS-regulon protein